MKRKLLGTVVLLALLLAAVLLPGTASAGEVTRVTVNDLSSQLIAGKTLVEQNIHQYANWSRFFSMTGNNAAPTNLTVKWIKYNGTSWVNVDDDEEIESNTRYHITIKFRLSGDHFASGCKFEGKLKDLQADKKDSYDVTITGWVYSKTHYGDSGTYKAINVTGEAFANELKAGTKPPTEVLPDDLYGNNNNYKIQSVKWYPTGHPTETTTEFVAGNKYTLSFVIVPGENSEFENNAAVYINGIYDSDVQVTRKSGTTWLIVTWDCPATASTTIDKIVLQGIKMPISGDKPQKSGFSAQTPHVDVVYLEWRDKNDNKFNGSFVNGQKYTLYLSMESDEPEAYYISNDATVTVNAGELREVLTSWNGAGDYHVAVIDFIAQPKPVSSITLSPSERTLTITADELYPCFKPAVTILPNDAGYKEVKWESDNPAVATVDATGVITAVGEGDCTITCSAMDGHGAYDTCKVTVIEKKVESVSLNSMKEYMTRTWDDSMPEIFLKATVLPADAVKKDLTWTSSNPDVVQVWDDGRVRAISEGIAEIICTATDGSGCSDKCIIEVTDKKAETVELNTTYQKLVFTSKNPKPTFQLQAGIKPASAVNQDVTWTSESPDVATVDEYGLVTAVGTGYCIINCTAKDGSGATATCQFDVEIRRSEGLVLNYPKKKLKICANGLSLGDVSEVQLVAEIDPDDTYNQKLLWSSDDTTVAVVDENGKVTAKGPGNCTIICQPQDGGAGPAYCDITVEEQPEVKSVTVKNGKYKLSGSTATLTGVKKKTLTKLVIQDTVKANGKTYKVTAIGASACASMAKLKTVKIGKYVKTVGAKAFWKCKALTTVTGGAAVTEIKDNAFAYCAKLKKLPAFGNLQSIGGGAFRDCKAMAAFTIPAKVKKIGSKAYYNCSGAKKFVIKTKMLTKASIGANAFSKTPKNAVAKCPSAVKKAYTKFLKNKGFRGKVQ